MSSLETLRELARLDQAQKDAAERGDMPAVGDAALAFDSLLKDVDWQAVAALTAERDRLREALEDLLEDTEHKDHDCGDADCCVANARAALAPGTPVDVE